MLAQLKGRLGSALGPKLGSLPPVAQGSIAAITAWHARYHTTARVINYELSSLTEQHRAEIATLRREIDSLVRQTLEEGAAAGVFDVPDVRGTTLALLSLTIDVARWFRATGARAPEELGAFYGELALRMAGHQASSRE